LVNGKEAGCGLPLPFYGGGTMSFGISILGNNFSIVSADTRGTKMLDCGSSKKGERDDQRNKVFLSESGWISTPGGVILAINYFKENLKITKATDIHDIYWNFLYSHKRADDFVRENTSQKVYKKVCKQLATSQAVCSYCSDEKKLGFNILDYGFDIREFTEPGTMHISNPLRTRKIIRITKKYAKLIKPYKVSGKHFDSIHMFEEPGDLNKAIYIVASIMHDVSKATKMVSSIADIGICLKLSSDEILLMSIHGKCEDLKAIYEGKKDYSEIMMVCGVLNGKPERMVTHG
jgi:hypothetical protein